MEIKSFKLGFFVVIIFLFNSCGIDKSIVINNSKISDESVYDIIRGFKRYTSTFYTSIDCMSNNNCLTFLPAENKVFRRKEDTIGAKSKYFPKTYFEYRGKLFVVYDSTEVIKQDFVNKLIDYNVLNSVYFNYTDKEIFENSIEVPLFKINEKNRGKDFIVEYKN